MDYITKETLDKYMKGKSVIRLNDFAEIFEKEFGIVIPFGGKIDYEKLSDQLKKKMTDAIFANEDVLEQLEKASTSRDYITNDDDALQIIREARNER